MELDMMKLEKILDDSHKHQCYIVVDCDYNTLSRFFETVIPVLWPWWNNFPSFNTKQQTYAYYLWDNYVTQYRPNNQKLSITYNTNDHTIGHFEYCNDAYYRRQGYKLYPKTLLQIINEVQLQIDVDILDLL